MKNLKTFKIFESLGSQLGEVEDIIQSVILDDYDSELILLGLGTIEEGIVTKNYDNITEVTFPASQRFIGYSYYTTGHRFGPIINDRQIVPYITSRGEKSEFIIVIIDFPINLFFSKNKELYDIFKMVSKRILSMTGSKLFNIRDKDFEFNGILAGANNFDTSLGNWQIDWNDSYENVYMDDIRDQIHHDISKIDDEFIENPVVSFTLIVK